MKILIALTDMGMGGVTNAAVNFSNELAKHGNDVYFLDMSGGFMHADALLPDVKRATLRGRSKRWNLGAADIKKARGIRKAGIALLGLVKKVGVRLGFWHKAVFKKFDEYGDFDAAIAYRQCAPCYSFVLGKVNARKKFAFVHGELKYMGNISSWQKYMKKFDKVCYVSDAVRKEFISEYPYLEKNGEVVYNIVDNERVLTGARKECDMKFDSEKINIVSVTRVENDKSPDRIPRIARGLRDFGAVFEWWVVGGGTDLKTCENLADTIGVLDCVHFVGTRENPYPFYLNADFSVLTSRSEAYGMAVKESIICGTPAVAGKYAALSEILDDGITGIAVEQDEEDFVRVILSLINDKGKLETLRQNCKNAPPKGEFDYSKFVKMI